MSFRILKWRCGGARRRYFNASILVGFSILLLSCDRQEPETYAAAREYFYGAEGKPGYLVSSWEGAYRSERLVLRRAGYGLSDEWQYVDESLDVRDLGSHEYFFRYSIWFRNPATQVIVLREESYYSIGEELWVPVPLTSNTYTMAADGRAEGSAVTQALWRCDFDGFLADRDVDCVRRVQTGK